MKSRIIQKHSAAFSVLALSAGMLCAAPGNGGMGGKGGGHGKKHVLPPTLVQFDLNGDGMLNATERAAAKAAFIAKYDTNGDGVLNSAEMNAARADIEALRVAERTAAHTALDTDVFGGLSLDEFTAGYPDLTAERSAAMFAKIDKNSDGSISLEEFLAPPPIIDKGCRNKRVIDRTALFGNLDTDLSGGLSAEEFAAGNPMMNAKRAAACFAKIDKVADGSISLDEFLNSPLTIDKTGKGGMGGYGGGMGGGGMGGHGGSMGGGGMGGHAGGMGGGMMGH